MTKIPLTPTEAAIHNNAIRISKKFRGLESELIQAIQRVAEYKVYEKLEYPSLHVYAVKALGLSDAEAYQYTRVAQKCTEIPELQEAVVSSEITVNQARRVLKVIDEKNSKDWIGKAKELKQKDLEREVAKAKPETAIRDKIKPVTDTLSEFRCAIPKELEDQLIRIRDLESQRLGRPATMADVLTACSKLYLQKKDPVEKAKRLISKPINTTKTVLRQKAGRRKSPAQVIHQVNLRDQGQCAYRDTQGSRCENRRHLQVHHRIPVSQGGPNTIQNLITLCASHHRYLHTFSKF